MCGLIGALTDELRRDLGERYHVTATQEQTIVIYNRYWSTMLQVRVEDESVNFYRVNATKLTTMGLEDPEFYTNFLNEILRWHHGQKQEIDKVTKANNTIIKCPSSGDN